MNFSAVLVLPKTAGSAQTHKRMSFIWIVWSTLYVYLWWWTKDGRKHSKTQGLFITNRCDANINNVNLCTEIFGYCDFWPTLFHYCNFGSKNGKTKYLPNSIFGSSCNFSQINSNLENLCNLAEIDRPCLLCLAPFQYFHYFCKCTKGDLCYHFNLYLPMGDFSY